MTKLIVSVDRPDLSQITLRDRRRDFEYLLDRLGVSFEVAEGCWEGEREQSYIIKLDGSKHFRKIRDVAHARFNQDAILKVSAYGGATLIMRYGEEEAIGELVQVNEVPSDQCYTQRYSDGAIFVVKNADWTN
jgi:hypothetical protein